MVVLELDQRRPGAWGPTESRPRREDWEPVEWRHSPSGTCDRWVRAYRDQGLDGLRPPPRADLGTVRRHPDLLEEACQLRQELPARSAAQIAALLKARHGVRIPARTIRAHFRRRGLNRAALASQPGRAFGRCVKRAKTNRRFG